MSTLKAKNLPTMTLSFGFLSTLRPHCVGNPVYLRETEAANERPNNGEPWEGHSMDEGLQHGMSDGAGQAWGGFQIRVHVGLGLGQVGSYNQG